MATLQKTIRYAGDAQDAPVSAIDAEFQLPVHEYYVVDGEAGDSPTVTQKRIVATDAITIATSITAQNYQVDLGSAFLVGKDRALFRTYVAEASAAKSLDNLTVDIDVVYYDSSQFAIGKETLALLFFPKFDLDAPMRVRAVDAPTDALILIDKEAFTRLSRRLTQAAGRFDSIALLSVISLMTDTAASHPELARGLSPADTAQLNAILLKAGVENPPAMLDSIRNGFAALFDIPLTIPAVETVRIAGTLTVVTSDAAPVEAEDFLAYDLSAQFSIRETGELQIRRFSFAADVVPQENSVAFVFDDVQPILRESVAGPILVQVRGSESILWSKSFKVTDPQLNDLDISVPLQRGTRVEATDGALVPAAPKKLRGQVLELSKVCALKDLTIVIQAKTADDQPWRVVAAGKTDGSGNFSMPYPYGIFTAAQAIVSLKPNDPVAVTVTAERPVNQTIADDFLYLLILDADCSNAEGEKDCDCDSPKKAARLPDYADLIGSDQYTQDIGGACVNLSTPNRTLSEFNYHAIVRTSDPEVANYTLRKVDPPVENVTAALNRLAASNSSVNSQLCVLNRMNAQLNTMLNPMDAGAYAQSNSVLASLNAIMSPLNAALEPVPAAPLPSLSASLNALTAAATALDAYGATLGNAAAPIQSAIDAAANVANAALTETLSGAALGPSNWFDFISQAHEKGANAWFNPFNSALASTSDPTTIQDLRNALIGQLGDANRKLSDALQPSRDALHAALNAADAVENADATTRYELIGGAQKIARRTIDLDNPVAWNDAPEPAMPGVSSTANYRKAQAPRLLKKAFGADAPPEVKKGLSFYQAVTVATGHILHYKSLFKADGYSLGDLVYSLPLAPGQKKQIVVLEASHTLQGAESQRLAQGESLAASIANERDILTRLSGTLTESMRGSSSANTSGVSAGFGTAGQGYGGVGGQQNGGGYGGSGSAVIGVAGGTANSNSVAAQDSSRDVSEFFADKLRQSIMQNAESYRQLNASVVTTVQEGQRYGVTSEVVANHNHCHALTMMYFEVLRHYAIFQELSSVEECVFVPLLMTNFTTDNIYKWRDVLAMSLLPMPSDTYLQTLPYAVGASRPHPLIRAFDANERIRTRYANVDFPDGAYDDEPIQFIRGSLRMTVHLPRPKTRFDRILSFPLTRQVDTKAMAGDALQFSSDMVAYSAKVAATAGIFSLFEKPPTPPNPTQYEITAREAIFDAFMSLDANYQTAAPADCIRIRNFRPPAVIAVGLMDPLKVLFTQPMQFFADNKDDQDQWQAYADLLGYQDVLSFLNAYFAGNLISEWDTIFQNDIVPQVFEKIVSSLGITELALDFSTEVKYKGGERQIQVNLNGTTSRKRNQLPLQLRLGVNSARVRALQKYVTLDVDDLTLTYSTAHYNGVLFSGAINDDLLDGVSLYIPENNDEKRNPRKEDAYLQSKLIEHLNSNLEHYNKALWFNLDPDRRYMLLDGFGIQTYNEAGKPVDAYNQPIPLRSLASVVKNELVTITGNAMVFPVAAGYRVSQDYILERVDVDDPDTDEVRRVTLLDHYRPLTPIEPYRISVPTRGVFCEAVQGACNACERIETERLQDWTKFPNPDEPTPIGTITPPTPIVTDWKAAFKDFATPIVNIQNAPAAPAPGEGMAALTELLGKTGVFKDVTGLEGNQANVIRTYLSNQENAKAFAEMAKDMAMQSHNTQNSDRITQQIDAAKAKGAIDAGQTNEATMEHIMQMIRGGVAGLKEHEATTQAIKTIPPENIEEVQTPKSKVKAKPSPKPPAGPKVQNFPVGLKSFSTFTGGVTRPLDGNVTLDFIPTGDLQSMTPHSLLIEVNTGGGSQMIALPTGMYTVGVRYAPAKPADLQFLREPQLESLGINLDALAMLVLDLVQKDLASDKDISAPVLAEILEVPDKCKGIKFELVAEMVENTMASFEAELGVNHGFTFGTNGEVTFNTAGLEQIAAEIAAALKLKEAALVAALLSVFTLKSSLTTTNNVTIAAGNKIKVTFKPAFLKSFALKQVK